VLGRNSCRWFTRSMAIPPHGRRLRDMQRAPIIHPVPTKKSGTIKKIDAQAIGRASVLLGGSRQKADDKIDFVVGISGIKKNR
jgi:thymidine phosphorylase